MASALKIKCPTLREDASYLFLDKTCLKSDEMYHLYGNFAVDVRHFFPRISGSSVRFLSILSYSLAFLVYLLVAYLMLRNLNFISAVVPL